MYNNLSTYTWDTNELAKLLTIQTSINDTCAGAYQVYHVCNTSK
jgi:hypothetical protein